MTEPQILSIDSQESSSSKRRFTMSIQHRRKWNQDETQKYLKFVQENKLTLEQTEKKQKQRVYNRMSEYIGTRTTHQCRSHHQKVMKRHDSIDNFIVAYGKKKQALLKAQHDSKLIKARRIREKSVSLKINKQTQIKNQPLPQEQMFQEKQIQNYKLIRNLSKPLSKPKDSQPVYHQDESYALQDNIKPFRKPNGESCNIFQDRFKQLKYSHYNDVVEGEQKGDNYACMSEGKMQQIVKREQGKHFKGCQEQLDYDKQFDVNRISLNSRNDFRNPSQKFNRISPKYNQQQQVQRSQLHYHKKSRKYLQIGKVHQTCSDILKGKNWKKTKYISKMYKVCIEPRTIKILVREEQNFNISIQCPNVENKRTDQICSFQNVQRQKRDLVRQRQAQKEELQNYYYQKSELKKIPKHPEQKTVHLSDEIKKFNQYKNDMHQFSIHLQNRSTNQFFQKLVSRGCKQEYMNKFTLINPQNITKAIYQLDRNPLFSFKYQNQHQYQRPYEHKRQKTNVIVRQEKRHQEEYNPKMILNEQRLVDQKDKPQEKTGTGLVEEAKEQFPKINFNQIPNHPKQLYKQPHNPSKQSYFQSNLYHPEYNEPLQHFQQSFNPTYFQPNQFRQYNHHTDFPQYHYLNQFKQQMFVPQTTYYYPSQPYGGNFHPIQKPPPNYDFPGGKYQRGNLQDPRYYRN